MTLEDLLNKSLKVKKEASEPTRAAVGRFGGHTRSTKCSQMAFSIVRTEA